VLWLVALQCQETSGFLFEHSCPFNAEQRCTQCQKSVCPQHFHGTPNGHVCTSCTKKLVKTGGIPRNSENRDPYLYDAFYYQTYGVYTHAHWRVAGDGNDFTEADAEGLGLGPGSDWEHDMGAS
jgi:hypothetical protein